MNNNAIVIRLLLVFVPLVWVHFDYYSMCMCAFAVSIDVHAPAERASFYFIQTEFLAYILYCCECYSHSRWLKSIFASIHTFATVNINTSMYSRYIYIQQCRLKTNWTFKKIAIDFLSISSPFSLSLSLSCSLIPSNPIHFSCLFANGLWMFASRASRTIHTIFKYANNFRAASVYTFSVEMLRYYMFCINGGLIVKPCLPASAKLHKKHNNNTHHRISPGVCACVCVYLVLFPSHFSLCGSLIFASHFCSSVLVLYAIDFMSQTHANRRKREKKTHWALKKQLDTKY